MNGTDYAGAHGHFVCSLSNRIYNLVDASTFFLTNFIIIIIIFLHIYPTSFAYFDSIAFGPSSSPNRQ